MLKFGDFSIGDGGCGGGLRSADGEVTVGTVGTVGMIIGVRGTVVGSPGQIIVGKVEEEEFVEISTFSSDFRPS